MTSLFCVRLPWRVGFALVLVVCTRATAATAPDDDREQRSRMAFDTAETEYKLGLFDLARTHYALAYALWPAPEFLFNIGQCHMEAGYFEQAAAAFEAYLRERPDPPNLDIVRKRLEAARTASKDVASVVARAAVAPTPTQTVQSSNLGVAMAQRQSSKWWSWAALAGLSLAGTAAVVTLLWRDDATHQHARPSALPPTTLGTIDRRQ